MPLTPAEKQRKYREKLKNENPEKYNDMKKRNAERTKENRKRVAECDEDQINKMRKQWREEKRRKLNANLVFLPENEKTLHGNNNSQPETERNVPYRENNNKAQPETVNNVPDSENNNNAPLENLRNFRFKKILPAEPPKPRTDSENKSRYNAIYYENLRLKQQLTLQKKRVKVLQKKVNRYGKKILSLEETIKKLEDKSNSERGITTKENKEEMTPLSKTNSYVENNLPDIPEPQKEIVKRQLFEHNVLVSALKNKYRESKTVEKNVLKDVIESETAKKYKLKSKFSRYLGLKASIRQASHIIKKRRMNLLKSLHDFYIRDDVSRITAGKKEYKTFKKRQEQRRYLLQPLKSLYEKYKSENGKLSYTTFKKHRPFFVLPPKIMNRDTCACSKHDNLEMKLKKLYQMNLLTHKYSKELPSEMMCDVNSKDCAYNKCSLCQDKTIEFKMENVNLKDVVTWSEWALTNKEYHDKKTNTVKRAKMMVKQTKTGTVKDLISDFTKESINFKKHWYNIRHQFKMHQICLNILDEEAVAIHVDFSENYSCKLATEVQAMHFGASKVQFTLHTGILYTKDEDPLTFATISPNTYHGPEAVWAHLDPILTLCRRKYPKVNGVHFFSDGPTSQYRNKKNFYLFLENTKKLGFPNSTWNYSEASHGKGPADGVGGAIKRSLDAKVAYGVDIPDAQTAFNVLSQTDSKIMLFFVPESDITEKSYDLRPIPGTMAIHQIRNTPMKNVIAYRELSCFCSNLKGYCECLGIKQYNLKATSGLKGKREITPLIATKKKQKEESDYDSNETFSIHDSSDEKEFEEWREEIVKMDDNKKDDILSADTEDSVDNKDCNNIKNDVQEGDFVIFKYEENLYPGRVLSMNAEGALISAMKRALKSWKWPEKPDELLYPWEDIVRKINTPKQISKRGYFSVPEIDSID